MLQITKVHDTLLLLHIPIGLVERNGELHQTFNDGILSLELFL